MAKKKTTQKRVAKAQPRVSEKNEGFGQKAKILLILAIVIFAFAAIQTYQLQDMKDDGGMSAVKGASVQQSVSGGGNNPAPTMVGGC